MKLTKLIAISLLCLAVLPPAGCTKPAETPAPNTSPAGSSAASSSATAPTAAVPPTTDSSAASVPPPASAGPFDFTTDASGLSKSTVVMKTSKGTLKFKLYSKDAPNSTVRFVELVQSKFYNGLAFHRVVPGFVVQTGDPKSINKTDPSVGPGGSGKKQKGEFNQRKHIRGAVAMARAADPDSADSQFYICLGAFPHLDSGYTVIGQVVDYGEKAGDKDVLDRLIQWDEVTEIKTE